MPIVGNMHFTGPVFVWNVRVVEPRAIACFPGQCTHHTKLCIATASHVVATLLQFNYSLAVVTSLPTLLLRHLHEARGPLILWTFSSCMVLVVAQDTYFRTASATASVFSSCGQVDANLTRFDPFTTAFRRTV